MFEFSLLIILWQTCVFTTLSFSIFSILIMCTFSLHFWQENKKIRLGEKVMHTIPPLKNLQEGCCLRCAPTFCIQLEASILTPHLTTPDQFLYTLLSLTGASKMDTPYTPTQYERHYNPSTTRDDRIAIQTTLKFQIPCSDIGATLGGYGGPN
jgi:hypothetical protein